MNDANRLATPLAGEAFLVPVFVSEQEEAYLLTKIEEVGGSPVEEQQDGENGEGSSSSGPRKFKSKPTGWREVKGRRSMYWGGSIFNKGNTLIPVPLPAFMDAQFPNVCQRVADTGAFEKSRHKKPNHILVNEYLPGQGIFPHGDGPAYYPTVSTLSLGSHTILDIYAYKASSPFTSISDLPSAPPSTSTEEPPTSSVQSDPSTSRSYSSQPVFSILLPRRSLFILRGDLYSNHLHGISERTSDSLEELRKCVNWEEVSSRRSRWEMGDNEEDGTREWQRGRRVSLTMRVVEKVLKVGLSGRR